MEAEAFEDLQKGVGALRAVKDLTAGAVGGVAQVLIGMRLLTFHVEGEHCRWLDVLSSATPHNASSDR